MSSTTKDRPPRTRRCRQLAALAASATLGMAGLIAVASPAAADGVCGPPVVVVSTTTITCTAGGTGSVTVPAGVASGEVTLKGAGGGNAGPNADDRVGGKGALVVATLAVTSGQSSTLLSDPRVQLAPSHWVVAGAVWLR